MKCAIEIKFLTYELYRHLENKMDLKSSLILYPIV
jgi:hypothetical protein